MSVSTDPEFQDEPEPDTVAFDAMEVSFELFKDARDSLNAMFGEGFATKNPGLTIAYLGVTATVYSSLKLKPTS